MKYTTTVIILFFFVLGSYAQETFIETVFIKNGSLFKKPDVNSVVLLTFQKNEKCDVLAYVGKNVYHIKYKDVFGFVSDSFLEINDGMTDLLYDYDDRELKKLIALEFQRRQKLKRLNGAKTQKEETTLKDTTLGNNRGFKDNLLIKNSLKNDSIKIARPSLVQSKKIGIEAFILKTDSLFTIKNNLAIQLDKSNGKDGVNLITTQLKKTPKAKQKLDSIKIIPKKPQLTGFKRTDSVNKITPKILKEQTPVNVENTATAKPAKSIRQNTSIPAKPESNLQQIDVDSIKRKLFLLTKKRESVETSISSIYYKQNVISKEIKDINGTLNALLKKENERIIQYNSKIKQDSIDREKAIAAGYLIVSENANYKKTDKLRKQQKQDYLEEKNSLDARLLFLEQRQKQLIYKLITQKKRQDSIISINNVLNKYITPIPKDTINVIPKSTSLPQNISITENKKLNANKHVNSNLNNDRLTDKCNYQKNVYDKYYNVTTKLTTLYNVSKELKLELFKEGPKTSIFFYASKNLGCVNKLQENNCYVRVKLENKNIIYFNHTWNEECGEFQLKSDISDKQMLLLSTSPIESIILKGSKDIYEILKVDNKTLFMDKMSCIKS